jgi:CBS domain-containing protein
MQVYEFMTTKMDFIDHDRSVYDAVEIMVDRRLRHLVVRTSGKLGTEAIYGVLTARDVVFKVLARGINPKQVKVADVASKPVACISKDKSIEEAAGVMEKANIARLFVCDGDEVLGVLNLLDVMAGELILSARGKHAS